MPRKTYIHFEEFIVDLMPSKSLAIVLQRSRRRKKTIAVTVQKGGQILLKSPLRVSEAELRRFILSKSTWIMDKLKKAETRRASHVEEKNTFRLMGRGYEVQMEESPLLRKNGFCELKGEVMCIFIPKNLIQGQAEILKGQVLERWYREIAAKVFATRTTFFAQHLGVKYQSIKIGDPKSSWGNCDREGRLMFSWRVVKEPPELIDYLIVHELCHLLHFDHSKAFWRAVGGVLPDYKDLRARLRQAEHTA